MQIIFSNNQTVDLLLHTSPLAEIYKNIYKHLQNVRINFKEWDNPYYVANMTHEQLVDKLIFFGAKLSLEIDRQLCLEKNRDYFNKIHEVYEKNYNGNPAWLDFHELIHLCEYKDKPKILYIDYREKSGSLIKAFNLEWARNATTKIKAGNVFVQWAELGKTPYHYWVNNEPNDLTRMKELIKPWTELRPNIVVALEDIDTLHDIKISAFELWWQQYSKELCQYWNIDSWTTHDIFSVPVFGYVPDYKSIITQLQNFVSPVKVKV